MFMPMSKGCACARILQSVTSLQNEILFAEGNFSYYYGVHYNSSQNNVL